VLVYVVDISKAIDIYEEKTEAAMKNIAVYAGTFDPITFGHVDLIERASQIFTEVIVGIAASHHKKPLFTLDERVEMAKQVLGQYANVKVHGFQSLLLNFAREHQANVILRGLRAVADFDYEFQLASMNRFMNPKIESMFLMPAEKYMYISSSIVREITALGGDVSGFVPAVVAAALKNKYK
jgi:pantetheine-phosphate adenylyltransferase